MTSAANYPIPLWRVVLDGKDLTDRIKPRLLDLTLSECRGDEADQLDLRIHDHDGLMDIPKRGVTLTVAIGWVDTGLVEKGTFKVDEVEHSGSPDIITIRARSADFSQQFRARREFSWHDTTVGAIVRNIAGRQGLQPRVAARLASVAIKHLDQTNESDAALLTRLGKRFDAVATVKAGTLIFAPIGSGQTATGKTLPTVTILRNEGDQHSYKLVDRDKYSGVRAFWHNTKVAKRKGVLVGKVDNAKRLKETFGSEQAAKEAAQAEWLRIQRGGAQMSYSLALGRPDLYPEQPAKVSGFKPVIDATDWLVSKVTHAVTSSGYTTQLELETGGAAGAEAVSED